MCDDGEHYLESGDVRQGYVKPLGSAWKKVSYANVDGLAVFEGCIILGETARVEDDRLKFEHALKSMPELMVKPGVELKGAGIKGAQFLWKNRTVPYVLPATIPNPQRILDAIAHWHATTSIRFVPRTTEKDYVEFTRVVAGCASMVGRQGGAQQLVLRDECTTGNIIHELGHAVGLWHEQSRADRNSFVRIAAENVAAGKEHNFDQHIVDGIDLGPYDYGSIMHYPGGAFSANGAQTIVPLKPLDAGVVMGQRLALSAGDIAAVETLYMGVSAANA